ncbi:trifunctional dihydropteroate synthetase [Vermiconidia calcicola]|uniref:Trifunctional dihydropteroate synthetase n=1 Tax=Vermiconidia calcicola TaxID=1690605 RepID=A0ACC3MJS3_9PEZI|nr:trifunctional dihydropteroate synthetase [Vermiconidia calcicola]
MLEREFVLRPLCDLASSRTLRFQKGAKEPILVPVPRAGTSAFSFLQRLRPSSQPMYSLTPTNPNLQGLRTNDLKRRTSIMAILNTTPDSFSDGGMHDTTDVEKLKLAVSAQIAAGATYIDIGGQSSRPNAPDITAEEEIARVLPAIEAVKTVCGGDKVVITVDTYRAAVAEAAVRAGANIVNDISAGQLDPDMLPTVARLGCTYAMMHMRGTPATMQNEENCQYPDGLIPAIVKELKARIEAAQEAGVRRWRIILDPGIGFSKSQEQNLEILREIPNLRSKLPNFPWLIGSSRKTFIGKITGVEEPSKRTWGTAATVTAAVQGGGDILRVHDVAEMAAVAKMADAMYRV